MSATIATRAAATLALAGTRHMIDGVDDAMIALMAARRRLVTATSIAKREVGLPLRDGAREQQVRERAHRLALRLRVPPKSAQRLIRLLVIDACRQQATPPPSLGATMHASREHRTSTVLRLIPPPKYWRHPLALLPEPLQNAAIERVLSHALSTGLQANLLEPIQHRRVGIELSDLQLRWVLEVRDGQLRSCSEPAETVVRGSVTDLLLLVSRLEDADTLFFQRRLILTGDTELGLTLRNLLDRLPWEALPLGLRIVLQRGGRMARAARSAHTASAAHS